MEQKPVADRRDAGRLAVASVAVALAGIAGCGAMGEHGPILTGPLGVVAVILGGLSLFRARTGAGAAGLVLGLLLVAGFAEVWFVSDPRHREHRRGASCFSNLKQIGASLSAYAADNDGRLPTAANRWCDATLQYGKNPQQCDCPSAPDWRGGYAYDLALSEGPAISSVPHPGEAPLVFDARCYDLNMVAPYDAADRERHVGGWNTLFVDGHAKWWPRSHEADASIR